MNGRSFQTLIELTPGVVPTASTLNDGGQFSVNGQRAASNYWTVDGVSANIGTGASAPYTPGNGMSGALGSFSALGGTNSLVSIDAMQEFRIQTSTYAPEFGRVPGAQISIVTRSGTNQFHGNVFEYLRNDVLDASDWFNGYLNNPPLPKAKERQNDFGGTFSGPLLKNRTFFFFSYEGLRLRLPETTFTTVPDLLARQAAAPALQPYLNAFPVPNGQDNPTTQTAQFNASFSNPAALDAYSLRIDHKVSDRVNVFGRYNYSPSDITQRGAFGTYALNTVSPLQIVTQTGTFGLVWSFSPSLADDIRFNYSRVNASSSSYLDDFGGAHPIPALPFPGPFTSSNSTFYFDILPPVQNGELRIGKNASNLQRQINIVDNLSWQAGTHAVKMGVDFRRLYPVMSPAAYAQASFFQDVASAKIGSLEYGFTVSSLKVPLVFTNLSVFAQDTWRFTPRLVLTYGLRWDLDFAPHTSSGPGLAAALTFDDLAHLALAPPGTPVFHTPYGNVAPRIGLAYQLSESPNWGAVLRGGSGVFFDLATQEIGNTFQFSYPFGGQNFFVGGSFPLDANAAAPPEITPSNLASGILSAFYPHLQLPYTLQWNLAFEQGLGSQQTLSASYIGAAGRRLIQTTDLFSLPNPNVGGALLISNAATSDYEALQVQFQRQLRSGFQSLVSYAWSHSIDTASAGSYANGANTLVPTLNPNINRGPSDFDIRNAFTLAFTYDIPAPKLSKAAGNVLSGWSLQSLLQVHSAPPVNVFGSLYGFESVKNSFALVRPDVVPGIPLYLHGAQYPGGMAINNIAGAVAAGCPDGSPSVGPFCPPLEDANGNPLRQGDLGRNSLRGFGLTQWDFAVHREFPIRESVKLQFRAEMFNVLNHPNLGPPEGDVNNAQFGLSTQLLGQYLAGGNVGGGGFSPLYQIGGPRSIQFGLKLQF
jgi:hypothetical protein